MSYYTRTESTFVGVYKDSNKLQVHPSKTSWVTLPRNKNVLIYNKCVIICQDRIYELGPSISLIS
jgi:hypothetical protein